MTNCVQGTEYYPANYDTMDRVQQLENERRMMQEKQMQISQSVSCNEKIFLWTVKRSRYRTLFTTRFRTCPAFSFLRCSLPTFLCYSFCLFRAHAISRGLSRGGERCKMYAMFTSFHSAIERGVFFLMKTSEEGMKTSPVNMC